jgi:glycosyltransferase involved in cell wall biosynthesis
MNGISFIVRVRNEEATLGESIRSLLDITVPKEIIVILHLCTDKSHEIAKKLASENSCIHIYTYDIEISRAGYETLATDKDSSHSFITYCNWCFAKAKYLWKCKWDADFTLTPELLNYINTNDWSNHSQIIVLGAKNSSAIENNSYFTSCDVKFVKHIFWEVPYFKYYPDKYKKRILTDIFINHNSELSSLKTYWKSEPWYRKEDSDEARIVRERMDRLTNDFGTEPVGLARSMNPVCNKEETRILNSKPTYVNFFE